MAKVLKSSISIQCPPGANQSKQLSGPTKIPAWNLYIAKSNRATSAISSAFAAGKADILISTTIVEVGVNVPNSTVIVIKNAERFGLAQLHQLRGRVGRSSFQSYCVLLSQDKSNERLQTMASTTDGFKIAEKDLELRGTGQILGVKQSGKDIYMETMLKYPKLYKEIRAQAAKDVLLQESA